MGLRQENKKLEESIKERDQKIKELEDWKSKKETQEDEYIEQVKDFSKSSNIDPNLDDSKDSFLQLTDIFYKVNEEKNNLQNQIDVQETKKLAKAFEDTGNEYLKKEKFYYWAVVIVTAITFILSIAYFLYSHKNNLDWLDKSNSLSILGIIIFALYFVTKQYSAYRNLHIDMKHRQTLAQSYYNIINNVEDEKIKPELATKVVELLTTPPHIKEDKMGPPWEIIKDQINPQGPQ